MPPEMRQKFEQMVKQMRDSSMLEDKNRDGIPDRFETSLRIAGWFGKLTGNPQLKERLQQQLRAFGASTGTTTTTRTASLRASSAAVRTPPSPVEPARIRTTSTSGRPAARPGAATQQRPEIAARSIPHQSAVQRDDRNLHEGTGLGEFLRKLVIVSAVVIAGYVLIRLLRGG
jgi:hypothetical protein